jgi:amidase
LADLAVARAQPLGPLHGVPFTVKDVIEVAGVCSAAGLAERRHHVPAQGAVVVARLRAAGAILLGTSNCPPGGAGGETDNPVYGATRNPHDLRRSPGGSSGGEAAAVAAGLCAFGLGSDSGGSLRVPAHFCGVATLKPTAGRVPCTGVFNHPGGLSDPRSQIGLLARSVADLALVAPLLAGCDGRDSAVVPMPWASADAVDLTRLRVAVYTDDGVATPTPETITAVQVAAQALRDAGAKVTDARPAGLREAGRITRSYWRMHTLTGREVQQLLHDWDRFRTDQLTFMDDFDAVLCPVDAQPAPLSGRAHADLFSYTLPQSLSGWPGAVVRAGSSAAGLPIGVQISALAWREDIVLAAANCIEQALGRWPAPLLR